MFLNNCYQWLEHVFGRKGWMQLSSPGYIRDGHLAKVKLVARQGRWVTSLDLSDAYHHIPVREEYQRFLCFQVKDTRYMFLVLPFGLNSGPWPSRWWVKQLKRLTAPRQFILFQYLDDWLYLHSYQAVETSPGQLVQLWTINYVWAC